MASPDLISIFSSFNIIGSAIGISIGTASNQVVKSFTDGIIMPLLSLFIKTGDMENVVFHIGKAKLHVGELLSNLIYFIMVFFVIVFVLKYVMGGVINKIIESKVKVHKDNLETNTEVSQYLKAIKDFNVPL